jgi:hypothetical protein
MAARNAATADLANTYAIARRIGTEHARRDNQGHRERCRRGSKTLAEVTAREGKRLGGLFHAGCSLFADLLIGMARAADSRAML